VTEAELENQKGLLKSAFAFHKRSEFMNQFIEESVRRGYDRGSLRGFWYGFAAGAGGLGLSLVITWMMYS
jgi:hypothetical protein